MKTFRCEVYPFEIWVGEMNDIKGINKKFEFYNNVSDIDNPDSEPLLVDEKDTHFCGLTYIAVNKKSKLKGAMVFLNKKIMEREDAIVKGSVYSTIAHEAKHIVDIMSEEKGIAEAPTYDCNEHQAFLIGYIAGCIGQVWDTIKDKKS